MNSAMATNTDSTRPDASTIKIPPRFWIPMGPVSRRSSSKQLLPRHHFSFSIWSRPSSKMLRMAMLILSLYGDPGSSIRKVLAWKKHQLVSVIVAYYRIHKKNIPYASPRLESFIFKNSSIQYSYYWWCSVVTERCPDAVAFAVNEPPHFCQVTVPPGDVIDCGWLHEESVIRLHHPLNPIFNRFHQGCAWPAAHKSPHLLKSRNLWFLKTKARG